MQRTAWLWITTRKMTETCRRRTKVAIFMTHSLLLACPSSAFLGMAVGSSRAPTSISRAGAHYITWPRRGSLPTALTMQQDAGNLEQDSTPLVDALAEASANVRSPLFYPGHKMGSGAPSRFVDVILGGKLDALRHDLPELPELDNLFAPEGPIRDAELLAAEAFGAAKTWLLANGSVIILPRDAHKSAVHALVLSGATPCFLPPLRHPDSGVSLGIGTAAIQAALEECGEEVAAVFLVSPTYEGACANVTAAAQACHAAGIPLIVDEAHGAHLSFLESEDGQEESPKGALECGADLVVQSAHKTLGSLTQSAFLHLGEGVLTAANSEGGDALSAERTVSNALATVQSSSPSYLLLASLDAARWSLAGAEKDGRRRLREAVQIARGVRKEVLSIQGVNVLELGGEEGRVAGFVGTDPLRLTVSFEGGLGGYEADDILIEEFGVYAELPAPHFITFVFGPGSTLEHGQKLTTALRHIAREASSRQASGSAESATMNGIPAIEFVVPPRQICTPREAFFARSKTVPAREAIGLPSAETVCPYPPGIPTLLPGEAITQEALDMLTAVKEGGGVISGCTDATLATMKVVDSHASLHR